jgi:hypothetical protein
MNQGCWDKEMNKKYFLTTVAFLSIFTLSVLVKAGTMSSNYECQAVANDNLDFPNPVHVWVTPAGVSGRMIGNDGQGNVSFGIVMEVEDLKRGDAKFEINLNLYHAMDLSGLSNPSRVTRILVYTNHAIYDEQSSVYRYFEGSQQVGGTLVLRGSPIACLP